jgi:hypothetical protein
MNNLRLTKFKDGPIVVQSVVPGDDVMSSVTTKNCKKFPVVFPVLREFGIVIPPCSTGPSTSR